MIDKTTDNLYQKLLKQINSYQPQDDREWLKKAFEFALEAHADSLRYSGEPYINHCLRTALILSEWRLDRTSIISGLIHDSVEKGAANLTDVETNFGQTTAKLVDGVTNLNILKYRGPKSELTGENLKKLIVAMSRDLRVILIKIAEQLDNMESINYIPEISRRQRIAKHNLEVYAPLAERLGIAEARRKLEDLSFPIVYPDDYRKISLETQPVLSGLDEILHTARNELETRLKSEGVSGFKIDGRVKSLYSIFQKTERGGKSSQISEIHDLVALRILVKDIHDCYQVLGLVHSVYRQDPQLGTRDFIATPKPNGYRSIHTNVFGPKEKIIEIQIRTFDMHQEAEYGVASHIAYSAAKLTGASDAELEAGKVFAPSDKLKWVRQLIDWQEKLQKGEDFIDYLKTDALSERIFVFSPKGDVYDLPKDATPIDFAYAVHTELGDRTTGAKVNGKLVPLSTNLDNGDVCELTLASSRKKPSQGWLDFVVSNLAKSKIKKGLKAG